MTPTEIFSVTIAVIMTVILIATAYFSIHPPKDKDDILKQGK